MLFQLVRKNKKGIILIESIMGIAFAGAAVLMLTTIFISSTKAYSHSRNYTQAVYLAESKIEETYLINSTELNSDTTFNENINGVSFSCHRSISPLSKDNSLKQIEVTIQWIEPDGDHSFKIATRGMIP